MLGYRRWKQRRSGWHATWTSRESRTECVWPSRLQQPDGETHQTNILTTIFSSSCFFVVYSYCANTFITPNSTDRCVAEVQLRSSHLSAEGEASAGCFRLLSGVRRRVIMNNSKGGDGNKKGNRTTSELSTLAVKD